MSGFSLLLRKLKDYKPFKKKTNNDANTQAEPTAHFAHLSCTTDPLPKDLPTIVYNDAYAYSYNLKQNSGFIIIDVTRNDKNSDVVYTVKHLPSGKLFRFSKQVFEFLFAATVAIP